MSQVIIINHFCRDSLPIAELYNECLHYFTCKGSLAFVNILVCSIIDDRGGCLTYVSSLSSD